MHGSWDKINKSGILSGWYLDFVSNDSAPHKCYLRYYPDNYSAVILKTWKYNVKLHWDILESRQPHMLLGNQYIYCIKVRTQTFFVINNQIILKKEVHRDILVFTFCDISEFLFCVFATRHLTFTTYVHANMHPCPNMPTVTNFEKCNHIL